MRFLVDLWSLGYRSLPVLEGPPRKETLTFQQINLRGTPLLLLLSHIYLNLQASSFLLVQILLQHVVLGAIGLRIFLRELIT